MAGNISPFGHTADGTPVQRIELTGRNLRAAENNHEPFAAAILFSTNRLLSGSLPKAGHLQQYVGEIRLK